MPWVLASVRRETRIYISRVLHETRNTELNASKVLTTSEEHTTKQIGRRGSRELSSFSRAYAAREGVNGHHTFFKNVISMLHCDFEKGSQTQHFQSTSLVGREGVR